MTKERKADAAIIGGGLDGCAAALAAARAGRTVVMTEETIGSAVRRRIKECRRTSTAGSRSSVAPRCTGSSATGCAGITGRTFR